MIEAIQTGIEYGLVGIGAAGTFITGLLLIGFIAAVLEAITKKLR